MLTIALQVADKHEAEPSVVKPSDHFNQTIKLGSASSWNRNILSLFHVGFDQSEFSSLDKILDAKYLKPPEKHEDCYEGINTYSIFN